MQKELPKRQNIRLTGFDYSQAGYYFVTICTVGRLPILRRGVVTISTKDQVPNLRRGAHGAPEKSAPEKGELPPLTELGHAAEAFLLEIPDHYDSVSVDKYVVMPNHIHAILIFSGGDGRTMCAPTLSRVVRAWKEAVTKQIGKAIWQKGYYDHVIRNEADYLRIWQYIDDNPAKWADDEYYTGA